MYLGSNQQKGALCLTEVLSIEKVQPARSPLHSNIDTAALPGAYVKAIKREPAPTTNR
jgi:hypothetical protein